MKPINYEELDPGIREVVRRLRLAGFATCDSGDGESKPEDERELNMPHVFSRVNAGNLLSEAHRLKRLVQSWGVPLEPETAEVDIEASYSPIQDSEHGLLMLIGLNDDRLQAAQAAALLN